MSLTRHGIDLIFGKDHTQFSLFNKMLVFFFSQRAALIIGFHNCRIIIIYTVFPLVIMFDHSEHIMDWVRQIKQLILL